MNVFAQARFMFSVAAPPQFPTDAGAEVAFAGRSNAGKSSAINALTTRKALARTSKTPGQTRLLNYFELAPGRRLVDLPGYGYAEVRDAERRTWLPLLDALRERASLVGLVLIIDSRRGVRAEDIALIEWADPGRRRVHLLLAKADKLNQGERAAALRDARSMLDAAVPPDIRANVTAQVFSAHDGTGLRDAQKALAAMLARHREGTTVPG
jgi:GTP-binding protein